MASRKLSSGILLFRRAGDGVEVFLVHPGGPYFARKDAGAWSIPKGEVEEGEEPLEVALREFAEETGQTTDVCAPDARPRSLGSVRQRGGKTVLAWALEGEWPDGVELQSNAFEIEWPPRSGRLQSFPEVDRGGFFPLDEAREKINPVQVELLDRLLRDLESDPRGKPVLKSRPEPVS
jgi:predicted NUDIX family NTP pyrophosphohydrolase